MGKKLTVSKHFKNLLEADTIPSSAGEKKKKKASSTAYEEQR